jgi:hypothetical protein
MKDAPVLRRAGEIPLRYGCFDGKLYAANSCPVKLTWPDFFAQTAELAREVKVARENAVRKA